MPLAATPCPEGRPLFTTPACKLGGAWVSEQGPHHICHLCGRHIPEASVLWAWRTLLRTPTLGGHGHHPRLQKRERGRARGDSAEAARSHSRRQDVRAHVLRATASRRTRTRRPHPSCSGQGPSWPRRARAGSRTRAKPPVTVPCCGHPGARTALPRSGSSSQRPFQGRVMCPTQATTSRSSSAPGTPQRKAAPPR